MYKRQLISSPKEPLSNFSLFLGTAPIARIPMSMVFKISTSLTQPFIITPAQLFLKADLAIGREKDAKLFFHQQNLSDNRAQNMLHQQNLIL